MADVQATGLRRGMAILHDGVPYRVLDGSQRAVRFSATQSIERARIDVREMDYLYSDGSGAVFMDAESYEQLNLDADLLGDASAWLTENTRLHVELLDGRPIGITLPKVVEIGVREAEAVVKGQTAARSSKPAVLENGITIQVPLFVESGDRVRVDPAELRYIERAK